jgi:two-component system chemotaxis response regulator CheY
MAKTVDRSTPTLVVDDSATMVRIIRHLLQQLGFVDVDDAPHGAAALARMHEKKYGLVISDWNMEPMTGLDLLKRVRANPGLTSTPFVLVTAESNVANVVEAKWAGVDSYIVKPFDAQKLSDKIEQAFGFLPK